MILEVNYQVEIHARLFGQVDHLRCKTLFDFLWITADDKVTVLEAEKRSWESTPEAQAIRDSLNPWREHDKQAKKSS